MLGNRFTIHSGKITYVMTLFLFLDHRTKKAKAKNEQMYVVQRDEKCFIWNINEKHFFVRG